MRKKQQTHCRQCVNSFYGVWTTLRDAVFYPAVDHLDRCCQFGLACLCAYCIEKDHVVGDGKRLLFAVLTPLSHFGIGTTWRELVAIGKTGGSFILVFINIKQVG